MRRTVLLVALVSGLACLLVLPGAALARHGFALEASRSPPRVAAPESAGLQSVRVDVGGRHLALRCQGEGRPAVILEAGLGDAGTVWEAVLPRVARFTRACAYDRADLGESDPSPAGEARTVQDAVDDLGALLSAADLGEAVVLAGHSAGGLIALIFAQESPARVAGLVLVDSSHPNQTAALAEVRPRRAAQAWEAFLAHSPSLERWDVAAAFAQGRDPYAAPNSLGDLPLVVLTRETTPSPDMVSFYTEVIWEGYSLALLEREEEVWLRLQRELAALSTGSEHRVADTNDHYLHVHEPAWVAEAIRRVVAEARRAPAGAGMAAYLCRWLRSSSDCDRR